MDEPDITRLKIPRKMQKSVTGVSRSRFAIGLRPIVVAIAIMGGLWWVHSLQSNGVEIKTGSVVSIYPSQAYTLLTATGYIVPQTKADVASKATGKLEKMEVAEGDRVKKGQILARIENSDLKANLNRAEAELEAAKTTLDSREADLREAELALHRADYLVRKQFLSAAAYDVEQARHNRIKATVANARALIKSAEAFWRSQQVALEYTLIRAPFDGVILSKNADVGDMLAPFASTSLSKGSVVSMADMDTLEVEADVSESNLLKVYLGQACEVQLDAIPDERFTCRVSSIVPTLDKTKATILVKTRFTAKDPRFLPDMSAKVAFLSQTLSSEQQHSVQAIPTAAIAAQDGQQWVFRVAGEKVTRIRLMPGERLGDFTVIDSVLRVGDQVVLNPQPKLQDGDSIRMAKP